MVDNGSLPSLELADKRTLAEYVLSKLKFKKENVAGSYITSARGHVLSTKRCPNVPLRLKPSNLNKMSGGQFAGALKNLADVADQQMLPLLEDFLSLKLVNLIDRFGDSNFRSFETVWIRDVLRAPDLVFPEADVLGQYRAVFQVAFRCAWADKLSNSPEAQKGIEPYASGLSIYCADMCFSFLNLANFSSYSDVLSFVAGYENDAEK